MSKIKKSLNEFEHWNKGIELNKNWNFKNSIPSFQCSNSFELFCFAHNFLPLDFQVVVQKQKMLRIWFSFTWNQLEGLSFKTITALKLRYYQLVEDDHTIPLNHGAKHRPNTVQINHFNETLREVAQKIYDQILSEDKRVSFWWLVFNYKTNIASLSRPSWR